MNVIRSKGEPNLIYILLTERDRDDLRKLLKGMDVPLAKTLRRELKAV